MTHTWRIAVALSIAALILTVSDGSAAAANASLGVNLVVNGGAEAGSALPNKSSVPGWTTTGHFVEVNYGYDGYPATTSPGPSDRGRHMFSGGTADPVSNATQRIDVSSLATAIDAGRISYSFSAWIGGFSNQTDYATVNASFMSASHARLGGATLGPATTADRQGVTALLRRAASGHVPAGTRSVKVTITSTRFQGASNDGYTDNIALVLGKK